MTYFNNDLEVAHYLTKIEQNFCLKACMKENNLIPTNMITHGIHNAF